jgi:hypothetical protein
MNIFDMSLSCFYIRLLCCVVFVVEVIHGVARWGRWGGEWRGASGAGICGASK